MIWTEQRVARKEYPCGYGEGEPCPLGAIKPGELHTYSKGSPGDYYTDSDQWVALRLHLVHGGATVSYDPTPVFS